MNFAGRLRVRAAMPIFAAIAAMVAVAAPATAATGAPQAYGSAVARQAAQVPAPPHAGYTPAAVARDVVADFYLYYTGADTHAYETYAYHPTGSLSLGGRLIGGPGTDLASDHIYGRGVDNALWEYSLGTHRWSSLGGRLTSRPGVGSGILSGTGGFSVNVVVRGTDRAVWIKRITNAGPRPWRSLAGRVLAGSGPAAVNVDGTLYVLAVGTDRAVWVRHSTDGTHWTGWRSLGGRVSGDLGAARPARGVGVVFARGTDNAAWYKEFAGTTPGVRPGWHKLGGILTSGVGAGSAPGYPPEEGGPQGMTMVVVMGTDNHIWKRTGTWPGLGGWERVF